MKAYEIQQGSSDSGGLQQVERPEPTPLAGQILVRMRAASLNYRDQGIITGRYFGGKVSRNTVPLSAKPGDAGQVVKSVALYAHTSP